VYISEGEELSVVHNLDWVATGCDINHVVSRLERYAAKSMECASRRGLQFDTAKTEVALLMCRWGYRKHLRRKLTAKISVGNGSI